MADGKTKGTKGCCLLMCPEDEGRRREKEGLLHKFEILEGTESLARPKADTDKLIKEYSRSAAGQKLNCSKLLRPPPILLMTVEYMIDNILIRKDVPWKEVYDYVFDRLRAIRQDMVVQDIWDLNCVKILEMTVRFHIYSAYRLREEPLSSFDPFINVTHLQECLKRLLVLYNFQIAPHSPEIISFYLLLNIGNTECLSYVFSLPSDLRSHKLIRQAFYINLSWMNGNYVRTFRLIRNLTYLEACTIFPSIEKLRRKTLFIMNKAYFCKNGKYPLKKLMEILNYNSVLEGDALCRSLNLEVKNDDVYFSKNIKCDNFTNLSNYDINGKGSPCLKDLIRGY